ncbi:lipoyl(octanoyl) transferase [Mucor circinelloides 1006PhL]|uniref:lipoyl(octanoyl) transferase n=1 Tax=Mucor circinelloides f. circinelloides (strain 1006PhL) TaxID=1220926 RepID=S2J1X7_MUCC1|nr:lipoyl(octanoyl) transferase [Mucor circinelloides 1006PhL]
MINSRLLARVIAPLLDQRLSYSTAAVGASCQGTLVKPINDKPIGYLTLPGLVKYDAALELQSYLVSRRHKITQNTLETSEPADMICFLQHPPTFTAGRRIRGKTEQEEEERLKKLGADYYETMRGGQITFHGPGQLIAYPILDVRDYQLNVRCYVSRLEKTIIDCCAKYDIQANTTENTGVWVGQDKKIAALGVHLQRYVSSHGLALNCNVDLSWFDQIVPCGLSDKGVTSITKETGKQTSPQDCMWN